MGGAEAPLLPTSSSLYKIIRFILNVSFICLMSIIIELNILFNCTHIVLERLYLQTQTECKTTKREIVHFKACVSLIDARWTQFEMAM